MPTYPKDDASSVRSGSSGHSARSGSSGHSARSGRVFRPTDSFNPYNSNNSINTFISQGSNHSGNNSRYNSNNLNYIPQNISQSRSASIGSIPLAFIRPTSPELQNNSNRPSMEYVSRTIPGTLSEELTNYQHYQQQLQLQQFHLQSQEIELSDQIELQYPSPELGVYQECLQWLQQSYQPVYMRELSQLNNVSVPITAVNAKHPSQIGGAQDVQVATWNDTRVQVMPIDRWGNPQEVLAEIQTLHSLRDCEQVIQLFGYLPSANLPSGQSPALLLEQPTNGCLRQYLEKNSDNIQWPERYKMGLDIAQGLRFLTFNGVPCTVNSGNILVNADGGAVLTGFGSPGGMITSSPCQMTTQPTGPSLVVYMAPERIMGRGSYSQEWSVYSLGVLLWELSSGKMPFEEIIARAESGPRLAKNMEQLSSAIVKGLREEAAPGTPDIYEQLYKMCWAGDAETRPPLEVIEETLQMMVVVEPMDMLMLPGEEMSMPISVVVSDSIDGDAISTHTPSRSGSVRSNSPGPISSVISAVRSPPQSKQISLPLPVPQVPGSSKPGTLHEAISVANADMAEWYILSGQDLNGYAIVPSFSTECEITPIQTCLAHFTPSSAAIFKELMDQDVDVKLLAKRSLQNCLHILMDRYISFKNSNGSKHLFKALDMLLAAGVEVNAMDNQGNSPLHYLMRNARISSDDVAEVVKRMVVNGADTSIKSPRDGNILTLAAKYLHLEAAKFILSSDITSSEPESIDKAIEACMTMTGRATDSFVSLRSKMRDLLKQWTGKNGLPKREKLAQKVMKDAGQLDKTGIRITKGKSVRRVPQPQLECANALYDKHIKKKKAKLLDQYGVVPVGGF
ncbi:hypothetical protein BGZ76_002268 [Entomortierella beljakovae]|nr:hypothetical protein BGZ76_002268 [Entomortierella beljakovae]